MLETFINNWQALGGTALITGLLTYFGSRKLNKANVLKAKNEASKAENEAEGQGIQNLDKLLELNGREIDKIEARFKAQLEPLNTIIAEQKRMIESQTKYIVHLEAKILMYKTKYGDITQSK